LPFFPFPHLSVSLLSSSSSFLSYFFRREAKGSAREKKKEEENNKKKEEKGEGPPPSFLSFHFLLSLGKQIKALRRRKKKGDGAPSFPFFPSPFLFFFFALSSFSVLFRWEAKGFARKKKEEERKKREGGEVSFSFLPSISSPSFLFLLFLFFPL